MIFFYYNYAAGLLAIFSDLVCLDAIYVLSGTMEIDMWAIAGYKWTATVFGDWPIPTF